MAEDKKYIKRCFELALKGTGSVSSNPLVGCIIVKEGKIIAEGFHKKFGTPHAEADAINNATENPLEATLYCNLEPCCHTNKKTPPCADKIIESGIKRVVISNIDPNPFVAGKGVAHLRSFGIEVITGILEEEGKYLNRFFFKHITTGLPYVTLKIAQSIDGKITSEEGKQTWLTGKESAQFVHSQRAVYDAVLVGANTVNIDDPQLNVRLVEGRNPKRIVVDGRLTSSIDAKIFNDNEAGKTILFTEENSDAKKIELLENRGVKIFRLPAASGGRMPMAEILKKLGEENIISILVEGGSEIFTQFISESLFNELIILKAPVTLGKGINAFNGEFPRNLNKIEEEMLGNDKKEVYIHASSGLQ